MLEQLISQLVGGEGQSFLDLQSLLRFLGPLRTSTGGVFSSESLSSSAARSSVWQGALGLTKGFGGVIGVAGIVGTLLRGTRTDPAILRPLPLVRHETPQGYRDEYAISRQGGVQSVVRQDEFGRSEARLTPTAVSVATLGASNERIDGRLFLQYSDEIAQAVRQALLYSHPLQDVLSE